MRPFKDLTDIGKLRRLRKLALQGLTHYDLKNPEIVYHGFFTNLLYRVRVSTGEGFMLRLASPGWRTLEDLLSEAMWLTALENETDISVPGIRPTRSGAYVLSVEVPGIPDVWHMTLMRYVPGRLLGHALTALNIEKMGRLFGDLHIHGKAWKPPAGFTNRRFEHWLSRGEENLIIPNALNSGAMPQKNGRVDLSSAEREWIARMHTRVETAYTGVNRADLRVIHCDLWHDNIKCYKGELTPLDFEDTVWGFRAHDIAMAMLDLLEETGEARYAELLPAFRRGYESKLDWPTDPIEPFQIGRLLWKINWVARFHPNYLGKMVQSHIPVFAHYEKTGQVILPEKN